MADFGLTASTCWDGVLGELLPRSGALPPTGVLQIPNGMEPCCNARPVDPGTPAGAMLAATPSTSATPDAARLPPTQGGLSGGGQLATRCKRDIGYPLRMEGYYGEQAMTDFGLGHASICCTTPND